MIIVSPRILNFFGVILNSGKNIRGLAFYPFIFLRNKEDKDDPILINHEKIHLRQQIQLLVIFFHIWYLIALYRKGYWNISFEREAYANEKDMNYLKSRKLFRFLKYRYNEKDRTDKR